MLIYYFRILFYQIIRTSNLQLWNVHISSCKDFGINIVESLGNTSVVNSVLIGCFHEKVCGYNFFKESS